MKASVKQKEYFKQYYLKNKEKAFARATKWQKNNPEKWKEISSKSSKKWQKTSKGIFNNLKDSSKKRKMDFILIREDFIKWYVDKKRECYYCGKPGGKKRLEIERKDNSLGYFLTNMELACHDCNAVKGNILTEEEMLIIGKTIMRRRWTNE